MKKIVASVGDFYHNELWIKQALESALAPLQSTMELELLYVDAADLSKALEENPAVVVLFKENRINPEDEQVSMWMDDGVSRQIERYVSNGGRWLAWHSGLASYPEDSAYVGMLKGYFISHPEQHKSVRYTSAELSAANGEQQSFSFIDEHYFVACNEAETEVFLRSESEDGSSIAGWKHVYGSGKVCCLTPAHRLEGLTDPEFIGVLRQSLEWCISSDLVL
ncbi:ThuA domain-containing protein [Cohnella silvisoli]|uniref:ThuA domain-containing protein n=1 Tax=Cohnella silvisoli TaxID=2873699 RepID=A0ABV1KZR9_9BACL|nr:ThuA domain-containing protein [Cohnella silvisoli]MCD9021818.1 ThuA domain-containing protein [Cohnella silvisoli]